MCVCVRGGWNMGCVCACATTMCHTSLAAVPLQPWVRAWVGPWVGAFSITTHPSSSWPLALPLAHAAAHTRPVRHVPPLPRPPADTHTNASTHTRHAAGLRPRVWRPRSRTMTTTTPSSSTRRARVRGGSARLDLGDGTVFRTAASTAHEQTHCHHTAPARPKLTCARLVCCLSGMNMPRLSRRGHRRGHPDPRAGGAPPLPGAHQQPLHGQVQQVHRTQVCVGGCGGAEEGCVVSGGVTGWGGARMPCPAL